MYVDVGQVVDMATGELLARGELRARGHTATVQTVEANRSSRGTGYADGLAAFLTHRRLLWMYRMMDHDLSAMVRAIATADGELTPGDLREIENAVSTIEIQGARYSESPQRMVDR